MCSSLLLLVLFTSSCTSIEPAVLTGIEPERASGSVAVTLAGSKLTLIGASSCSPTYNDRCYRYLGLRRLYLEQLARCHEWGGSLTSVTSAAEEAFLISELTRTVFIGLTYRDAGFQEWYWESGEPVNYTNWKPDQPDGTPALNLSVTNMVKLDGYQWGDVSLATASLRAMCEADRSCAQVLVGGEPCLDSPGGTGGENFTMSGCAVPVPKRAGRALVQVIRGYEPLEVISSPDDGVYFTYEPAVVSASPAAAKFGATIQLSGELFTNGTCANFSLAGVTALVDPPGGGSATPTSIECVLPHVHAGHTTINATLFDIAGSQGALFLVYADVNSVNPSVLYYGTDVVVGGVSLGLDCSELLLCHNATGQCSGMGGGTGSPLTEFSVGGCTAASDYSGDVYVTHRYQPTTLAAVPAVVVARIDRVEPRDRVYGGLVLTITGSALKGLTCANLTVGGAACSGSVVFNDGFTVTGCEAPVLPVGVHAVAGSLYDYNVEIGATVNTSLAYIPLLFSVAPSRGYVGQLLNVSGANLNGLTCTNLTFAGVSTVPSPSVSVVSSDGSVVGCMVPEGSWLAGDVVDVLVSRGGGLPVGDALSFQFAAAVAGIEPAVGLASAAFNLTGHMLTNMSCSDVYFDGAVASARPSGPAPQLVPVASSYGRVLRLEGCVTPATVAGTVASVWIRDRGGGASVVNGSYAFAAGVTSVDPAVGYSTQPFTLTGSGLGVLSACSQVVFGGLAGVGSFPVATGNGTVLTNCSLPFNGDFRTTVATTVIVHGVPSVGSALFQPQLFVGELGDDVVAEADSITLIGYSLDGLNCSSLRVGGLPARPPQPPATTTLTTGGPPLSYVQQHSGCRPPRFQPGGLTVPVSLVLRSGLSGRVASNATLTFAVSLTATVPDAGSNGTLIRVNGTGLSGLTCSHLFAETNNSTGGLVRVALVASPAATTDANGHVLDGCSLPDLDDVVGNNFGTVVRVRAVYPRSGAAAAGGDGALLASNALNFTYSGRVDALDPAALASGDAVTVVGAGLGDAACSDVLLDDGSTNLIGRAFSNANGTRLFNCTVPYHIRPGASLSVAFSAGGGTVVDSVLATFDSVPTVVAVTPATGYVDTTLAIVGTSLQGLSCGNVLVDGLPARSSPTSLVALLPGATPATVRLVNCTVPPGTRGGVTVAVSVAFEGVGSRNSPLSSSGFTTLPVLTSLEPNYGPAGQAVRLVGSGLAGAQCANITLNGTALVGSAAATNASGTALSGCRVPATLPPVGGAVVVRLGGYETAEVWFYATGGLASVVPARGVRATPVTVGGTNLQPLASCGDVRLVTTVSGDYSLVGRLDAGGLPSSVENCTVPSSAPMGSWLLAATLGPYDVVSEVNYTVDSVVFGVSPSVGEPGGSFNISGYPLSGLPCSAVLFDGLAAVPGPGLDPLQLTSLGDGGGPAGDLPVDVLAGCMVPLALSARGRVNVELVARGAVSVNSTAFTPRAVLEAVTPDHTYSGGSVTISGRGLAGLACSEFAAGGLALNGTATTVASPTGSVSALAGCRLPSHPGGSVVNLTATAAATGVSSTTRLEVTYTARVTAVESATAIFAGTTLTVRGSGLAGVADCGSLRLGGYALVDAPGLAVLSDGKLTNCSVPNDVPGGVPLSLFAIVAGHNGTSEVDVVVRPTVLTITPESGPVGTAVNVTGYQLDELTGACSNVSVGGERLAGVGRVTVLGAGVSRVSGCRVEADLPGGSLVVVRATVGTGVSSASGPKFLYEAAFAVANDTNYGAPGDEVVFAGSGLSAAACTDFAVNGSAVTNLTGLAIYNASDSTLSGCYLRPHAGGGPATIQLTAVVLLERVHVSGPVLFYVTAVVTSVAPVSGGGPVAVTINGHGFNGVDDCSGFKLGNEGDRAYSGSRLSDSRYVCSVPPNLRPTGHSVRVVSGGHTSPPGGAVYTAQPHIERLEPGSTSETDAVVWVGYSLAYLSSCSELLINGSASSGTPAINSTVWNATQSVSGCQLPRYVRAGVSYPATAVVLGVTSNTDVEFTYAPRIARFVPPFGRPNTVVTVEGVGFLASSCSDLWAGNYSFTDGPSGATVNATGTKLGGCVSPPSVEGGQLPVRMVVGPQAAVSPLAYFVVTANVSSVSPSTAFVNESVTVYGSGLKGLACTEVEMDGRPMHGSAVTSDGELRGCRVAFLLPPAVNASFNAKQSGYDSVGFAALRVRPYVSWLDPGALSVGHGFVVHGYGLAGVDCSHVLIGGVAAGGSALYNVTGNEERVEGCVLTSSLTIGTVTNLVVRYGGTVSNTVPVTVVPKVVSVTPDHGLAGTPFVLVGTSLAQLGCHNITVGGVAAVGTAVLSANYTVVSNCSVPSSLPGGTVAPVVVTVHGVPSTEAVVFSVTAEVASVTVASAYSAAYMTLTGVGFAGIGDCGAVSVGGAAAFGTAAVVGDSSVTGCRVPYNLMAGVDHRVVVTVLGYGSEADHRLRQRPYVTQILNGSAIEGTRFSLLGTSLQNLSSCSAINFGGEAATGSPPSVTVLADRVRVDGCRLPTGRAGGTTVSVTVVVNGECSNDNATLTYIPAIYGVNPSSGVENSTVTIRGRSLSTATCSDFEFGGLAAAGASGVVNAAGTEISGCRVPSGVAGGMELDAAVTMNGVDGWSNASYAYEPALVAVTPQRVWGGRSIQLRGSGFAAVDCANVTVGGVAAVGTASVSAGGRVLDGCAVADSVPGQPGGTVAAVVVTSYGVSTDGSVAVTFEPHINQLEPGLGDLATPFTIHGRSFESLVCSEVVFNGSIAATDDGGGPSVSADFRRLEGCATPSFPLGTNVSVIVTHGGASSEPFYWVFAPRLLSVSPTRGPEDVAVTLEGSGLAHTECADFLVAYSPVNTSGLAPGSAGSVFPTSLVGVAISQRGGSIVSGCYPPSGLTSGTVMYVAALQQGVFSDVVNYTIIPGVNSVEPTEGTRESVLTVQGVGFSGANCSNVLVGGVAATPVAGQAASNATTLLGCRVPPLAMGSTYNVTVAIGGVTSGYTGFTFLYRPSISGYSADSDFSGAAFTISGTGLEGTVCGDVSFGGSFSGLGTAVVSGSTLVTGCRTPYNAPANASLAVTVTRGGVASVEAVYQYVRPYVTSLNVTAGVEGDPVEVVGTSLAGTSCANLRLAGVPAVGTAAVSPTAGVNNSVTVTGCNVPPGVPGGTSGSVVVRVNGAYSNANKSFTFVPVVNTVVPNAAWEAVSVTLTGRGLLSAACGNFSVGPATLVGSASVAGDGRSVTGCYTPQRLEGGRQYGVVPRLSGVVGEARTAGAVLTVLPRVDSVAPVSGTEVSVLTIRGVGFLGAACANVSLDGLALTGAGVVAADGREISGCDPPDGVAAGTNATLVVELHGVASSQTVGYVYQPAVLAIYPTVAPLGAAFTLTGLGFEALSCSDIKFDPGAVPAVDSPAANVSSDERSVSGCSVPASFRVPQNTTVRVELGGVDSIGPLVWHALIPDLAAITPVVGDETIDVVLTGSGFFNVTCADVTFGGLPATGTAALSAGHTQLSGCSPPDGLLANSTLAVYVSASGAVNAVPVYFTYIPKVVSVEPTYGPGGTELTVTGAGFVGATCDSILIGSNATAAVGTASVSPNGTRLTGCSVPTNYAVGTVAAVRVVVYGRAAVLELDFLYAHVVSSLDPSTGRSGLLFTVTGGGFHDLAACSDVYIGGESCSGSLAVGSGGTTVSGCRIPYNLVAGVVHSLNISINGLVRGDGAGWLSLPYLLSSTPAQGREATALSLTGYSLIPLSCANVLVGGFPCGGFPTVRVASVGPPIVSVDNCTTPRGLPAGAVGDVVVSLGGVSSNADFNFTYTLYLGGVTPNWGPLSTALELTGSGFYQLTCASVYVGGVACGGNGTVSGNLTQLSGCSLPPVFVGGAVVEVSIFTGVFQSQESYNFTLTAELDGLAVGGRSGAAQSGFSTEAFELRGTGLAGVASCSDVVFSANYSATGSIDTGASSDTLLVGCRVPLNIPGGLEVNVTGWVGAFPSFGAVNFLSRPYVASISVAEGPEWTAFSLAGHSFQGLSCSDILIDSSPCTGSAVLSSAGATHVLSGCLTPSAKPAGLVADVVAVVPGSGVASNSNVTFTYTAGVSQMSPAHGIPFTTVTIVGSGFLGVKCGDVLADGIALVGNGTVTADGRTLAGCAMPHLPGGTAASVVASKYGVVSELAVWNYTAVVHSVEPIAGPSGTPLVIRGVGFDGVQPAEVTIDGSPCSSVVAINNTVITGCTSPVRPAGQFALVVVTRLGRPSNESVFFKFSPLVLAIAPTFGPVGQAITITGLGFNESNIDYVRVGGLPCDGSPVVTEFEISDCLVPSHVIGRTALVDVSVGGAASADISEPALYTYVPVVTEIAPIRGTDVQVLTIRGSGFSGPGDTVVTLDGDTCTSPFVTYSEIQCFVPSGKPYGPAFVSVVVNNTASNADIFYFYDSSIEYIEPDRGAGGVALSIYGSGFNHPSLNVTIDGRPCANANDIVVSSNEIHNCIVPDRAAEFAGSVVDVVVIVEGQVSEASEFTYTVAPVLVSSFPTEGLTVTNDQVFVFADSTYKFLALDTLAIRFGEPEFNRTVTYAGANSTLNFLSSTVVSFPNPGFPRSATVFIYATNDGFDWSDATAAAVFTFFSTPAALEVSNYPATVYDNDGPFSLEFVPEAIVVDADGVLVLDQSADDITVTITVYDAATRPANWTDGASGSSSGGSSGGSSGASGSSSSSTVARTPLANVLGNTGTTKGGRVSFPSFELTGVRGVTYDLEFSAAGLAPARVPNAITVLPCAESLANSVADSTGESCHCDAGYEGSGPTSPCTACPSGYYKAAAGFGECDPCLANKVTPPAATHVSQCVCDSGYYVDYSCKQGTKCPCTVCPKGGVCSDDTVKPDDGWWRGSDDVDTILECDFEDACVGGECAPEYKAGSPLCTVCAEDYALTPRGCVKCQDGSALTYLTLLLVIVGVVGFMTVLVRSALNKHKFSDLLGDTNSSSASSGSHSGADGKGFASGDSYESGSWSDSGGFWTTTAKAGGDGGGGGVPLSSYAHGLRRTSTGSTADLHGGHRGGDTGAPGSSGSASRSGTVILGGGGGGGTRSGAHLAQAAYEPGLGIYTEYGGDEAVYSSFSDSSALSSLSLSSGGGSGGGGGGGGGSEAGMGGPNGGGGGSSGSGNGGGEWSPNGSRERFGLDLSGTAGGGPMTSFGPEPTSDSEEFADGGAAGAAGPGGAGGAGAGAGDSGQSSSNTAAVIKMLVTYLQITAFVGEFTVKWPAALGQLSSATSVANVDVDFPAASCTFDFNFFRILLITMMMPVVIVAGSAVIAAGQLCYRCYRGQWRLLRGVWVQFRVTVLVLVFFTHPTITANLLEVFNCRKIQVYADDSLNKAYLAADMDVECYAAEHSRWMVISLLYLLFYSLGVPLFAMFLVWKHRRELDTKAVQVDYGFLYGGFNHNRFYWEIVILGRKVVITAIKVLLREKTLTQIYLALLTIVASVILHLVAKPFRVNLLGWLELFSLVGLFVYCMGGLVFYSGDIESLPNGPDKIGDMSYLEFGLCLFLIAVVVFVVAVHVRIVFNEGFNKEYRLFYSVATSCFPAGCTQYLPPPADDEVVYLGHRRRRDSSSSSSGDDSGDGGVGGGAKTARGSQLKGKQTRNSVFDGIVSQRDSRGDVLGGLTGSDSGELRALFGVEDTALDTELFFSVPDLCGSHIDPDIFILEANADGVVGVSLSVWEYLDAGGDPEIWATLFRVQTGEAFAMGLLASTLQARAEERAAAVAGGASDRAASPEMSAFGLSDAHSLGLGLVEDELVGGHFHDSPVTTTSSGSTIRLGVATLPGSVNGGDRDGDRRATAPRIVTRGPPPRPPPHAGRGGLPGHPAPPAVSSLPPLPPSVARVRAPPVALASPRLDSSSNSDSDSEGNTGPRGPTAGRPAPLDDLHRTAIAALVDDIRGQIGRSHQDQGQA